MQIKINNIELEAREGETILEVAGRAGIYIPTMCNRDGIEPYSSCMVCMVKDKQKDIFIPSCSAMVQDGMDIDASGSEVLLLRKKAVELLLSEHRAECEAPCRVVCPAVYNIPEMNRLLASGKIKEAIELSLSELTTSELLCTTCKGYCENACRRKKIDTPISIRNIHLFVYKNIVSDRPDSVTGNPDKEMDFKKKFASRIGRLDDIELKEWLKECIVHSERSREIPDFQSAGSEAQNCMHCDCRAAEDCSLRAISQNFSVKDPIGKIVNAPIVKKINKKNGLIFENAKCIKCGLCVRVCEDSSDEPALCFINRGFVSIISEPLTEEFDNILATQADKCIDVCPTGALSRFNS
ncbi:MAG: 2Fe-2S iron-sulfur cluster-binding protein [Bacteroidia bacterium]|nr:2Fe-2S iron-sulfur cluster-binding protein [Bacteroidia bacterium]